MVSEAVSRPYCIFINAKDLFLQLFQTWPVLPPNAQRPFLCRFSYS